jgi:cellulose synthase/poly-beta-1,6-N-acetylglucosamine synthase-like glycosyltransferase
MRIDFKERNDFKTLHDFKIAVVVCARNESKAIWSLLKSIENQNISRDKFTLYIINDASDDETGLIINEFLNHRCEISCQVITNPVAKGKKSSISDLVPTLNEEVIFTTDADCVLSPNVLKLVYSGFQKAQTQLISGPVLFTGNSIFISGFQEIEFFSLIASGAAFIGIGKPVMCNAANLAYRRSAYMASKPYADNLKISSGDDVFLLHAIKRQFGAHSIGFLLREEAIVYTRKIDSLKGFFHQRLRWGAKSSSYTDRFPVFIALYVYLINLVMLISYLKVVLDPLHNKAVWYLLCVKFVSDFFFLNFTAIKLKKFIDPITYFTTQFLLPFYIVFVGLFSQILTFNWKGKVYKK